MKLDNQNRAIAGDFFEEKNKIRNKKLRILFDDIQTIDNINSWDSNMFFNIVYTCMSEANHDLKLSIKNLDNGDIIGAYGHFKAAWEVMLLCLYINAGDKEAQKKRVKKWKYKDNNFKKMIDDHMNWDNFKIIMEEFPSFKKNQRDSDNRINKIRHKHSIKYLEVVNRANPKSWSDSRINNAIKDCEYLISMFLITWLILDPKLIIFGTDFADSRFLGSMIAFPTSDFLKKYIPEIDENFYKESIIVKDTYEDMKKQFEYSPDQQAFKGYSILSDKLIINKDSEEHFSKEELDVYNIWDSNKDKDIDLIVKFDSRTLYRAPNSKLGFSWSSSIWKGGINSDYWKNVKNEGFNFKILYINNEKYLLIYK